MTTPRDLAKASLEAVKARDKAAWLAVYEEDGLVQDPVGVSRFDATGQGHRGRAAIAAFWDVFMANQESFDYTIHHTAIGGDEVAAYATLHIGLKDGVKFDVPVLNVYRMSPNGKLASLRSFWEGG
jgi:steroid delta-isomerase